MSRYAWMILAATLVACGGNTEAPADDGTTEAQAGEKDASPTGVAKVAKAIKDDPAKQDAILKENGWTAAEFEKALWDIAQDAAKSAEYRKALGA